MKRHHLILDTLAIALAAPLGLTPPVEAQNQPHQPDVPYFFMSSAEYGRP